MSNEKIEICNFIFRYHRFSLSNFKICRKLKGGKWEKWRLNFLKLEFWVPVSRFFKEGKDHRSWWQSSSDLLEKENYDKPKFYTYREIMKAKK